MPGPARHRKDSLQGKLSFPGLLVCFCASLLVCFSYLPACLALPCLASLQAIRAHLFLETWICTEARAEPASFLAQCARLPVRGFSPSASRRRFPFSKTLPTSSEAFAGHKGAGRVLLEARSCPIFVSFESALRQIC